jgi:hypothetical protein
MMRTLVYVVILLVGVDSAWGQTENFEMRANASNAEIERILEQKRDMVFKDATLEDLVSFLIASGIPTYIDQRALDDVGLSTDEPIVFRQHAIRLRDGLKLALLPFDLIWTLRDGRLMITTPEADEDRLITRVYDVRHLVELVPTAYWGDNVGEPRTVYSYDFHSLIQTITSSIEPNSWVEVDGPGSIQPYYTRRMRVIVVSHTYDVHWQLKTLLGELSKHGGSKPLSPPSARASASKVNTYVRRYASPAIPARTSIRSSQLRTTGQ